MLRNTARINLDFILFLSKEEKEEEEEEEEEEAEQGRRFEKASSTPKQRADIHHGHCAPRVDKYVHRSVRRFRGNQSAAKDARLSRVRPGLPAGEAYFRGMTQVGINGSDVSSHGGDRARARGADAAVGVSQSFQIGKRSTIAARIFPVRLVRD
jgi:hypothetical protein